MLAEILSLADPVLSLPTSTLEGQAKRYLDVTLGRGGHLKAILDKYPHVSAVAFDQDIDAIIYAQKLFETEIAEGRLQLVHGNFLNYSPEVHGNFDFALADLGVSSPQLDQAERGFSFYHTGPLDMRMDQSLTQKASDILAEYSEAQLIELFKNLGEVSSPFRVVRAIVFDRKTKPFETTTQLSGLIERVDGWRKKGVHPATQYFLALRLEVNQELVVAQEGVRGLALGLKPQARMAVLTFHSLEDRIIKRLFKEQLTQWGRPLFKKVIEPTREELLSNPRSRSSKLRVFERILQDAMESKSKNKYR